MKYRWTNGKADIFTERQIVNGQTDSKTCRWTDGQTQIDIYVDEGEDGNKKSVAASTNSRKE